MSVAPPPPLRHNLISLTDCCADGTADLPELEPHQYGFRAGYLGSAFNLGSIFAGFLWGRLADSIGRRPVFLTCLGGLAVFLFAFAFAPTFWSAVFIRGIAGTFMGIPRGVGRPSVA